MAIGERIHFIRNLRGMTQKYLGILAGFPEKTADVRMAQYESGTRTPKADLTNKLAQILKVSPHALDLPNIDSKVGLMHTLFALEDIYGIKISDIDGEVCLRLDKFRGTTSAYMFDMLNAWRQEAANPQQCEVKQSKSGFASAIKLLSNSRPFRVLDTNYLFPLAKVILVLNNPA